MNNVTIIGREAEQALLEKVYQSSEAEFLAVYGRRRVGKTFLIKYFFSQQDCVFFHTTGMHKGKLSKQLSMFAENLRTLFFRSITNPTSWLEAFAILSEALSHFAQDKKIVLFFDELPWMATKRSGLLSALDYYWNTQWQYNNRLKLVVCGSSASWIIDNLINAKGGLYNRLTKRLQLKPFTLGETQMYLKHRNIFLDIQQVTELYMVMGGIPYYLREIEAGLSAKQNINNICFAENGLLKNEFERLFASLFDHGATHEELIKLIAGKPNGVDKKQLVSKLKNLSMGGRLTKRLQELETAGFIKGFTPYGHKTKGTYYQIIDEYTLFYLRWIAPVKRSGLSEQPNNYWGQKALLPAYKAWSGYAFEMICYKHIHQIRKMLSIEYIGCEIATWRYIATPGSAERGAKIDLLFDRIDGIINICEIKYAQDKFIIDKAYAEKLQKKIDVFRARTQTKKTIFLALITAGELVSNRYVDELVSHQVTLEHLFRPIN